MALQKIQITPERSGYNVKDGTQVLSAKLDGGGSRYRADIAGATATVTVRWLTDMGGFEYLRAFYQLTGAKGIPFAIDLILDSPYLTEHQAWFVPDTMQLEEQAGQSYTVAATLEVVPMERSDDAAQSIVNAYTGSPVPQSGGSLDGAIS